ncbi:DUF1471 domain-containing protein [Erwinia amylovora]
MKVRLFVIICTAFLTGNSFSALAATEVTTVQTSQLQNMGTVSVSGVRGSPDDALRQVKRKAEDMGASRYRIIGVDTPGNSSLWRATAEIYR